MLDPLDAFEKAHNALYKMKNDGVIEGLKLAREQLVKVNDEIKDTSFENYGINLLINIDAKIDRIIAEKEERNK